MTLGEKIQMLRSKGGMSQEQLAERLTVSRQSVSKWELGQSTPDLDYVVQLSEIFNVSLDYLVKDCDFSSEEVNFESSKSGNQKEKSSIFDNTVFTKFPFPFCIPAFIICSLFGFHKGWNWFGNGEPSSMQRFPFPFLVGIIYVALGLSGIIGWHPAWVVFLTVPIYYLIAWRLNNRRKD